MLLADEDKVRVLNDGTDCDTYHKFNVDHEEDASRQKLVLHNLESFAGLKIVPYRR